MFVINKVFDNPKLAWAGTIEYIPQKNSTFHIFFSINKKKYFEKKFFMDENLALIQATGFSFLGFNLLSINQAKLKMAMSI